MILPAHNTPPLVVFGAGGHGRVVADAARAAGLDLLGFLDDGRDDANPAPLPPGGPGGTATEAPLLDAADPRLKAAVFIVAIGDNDVRLRIARRLAGEGRTLHSVVHPDATVSPTATLDGGTYVGARAVVGPGAAVGTAALINTAAVVEHDGRVGPGAHVAPGAVLGGTVRVGEGALVGLGARVLPGLEIGASAVVGAGAVLTRDAEAGRRYVGVPARAIR